MNRVWHSQDEAWCKWGARAVLARGDCSKSDELSLCTGCLELAAFDLMVMTADGPGGRGFPGAWILYYLSIGSCKGTNWPRRTISVLQFVQQSVILNR